jgi:hypothetical protein
MGGLGRPLIWIEERRMVSLHVTAIGYLVSGRTGPEAYEILETHGYLSDSALSKREKVVSLIDQKRAAPKHFAPGDELWRYIDVALEQAGYLSPKGLTEGRRGLTRDGHELSEQASGTRAKAAVSQSGRGAWTSLLARLSDWLGR